MERSPSPVEARWLRINVGSTSEQIFSGFDVATEYRVDKCLLQELVGELFGESRGVHRWMVASCMWKEAAIGIEEGWQQIDVSHPCREFQIQGGPSPHERLGNLLTFIPNGLRERTPIIVQPIHWCARVNEEISQTGIVTTRRPLECGLSLCWVNRAGIDICTRRNQRTTYLFFSREVPRPITEVVQERPTLLRACIR